jgi:hypothetical protein
MAGPRTLYLPIDPSSVPLFACMVGSRLLTSLEGEACGSGQTACGTVQCTDYVAVG